MELNRRQILTGGAAVIASSALPLRVPAMAATPADQRIIDLAKREIERHGRNIWIRDRAAIVNFAPFSSQPRFHMIDLMAGSVRSYLVTHGRGSDLDNTGWLHSFSNQPNSAATSRGAYCTRAWYDGKNGLSMRLVGLEGDNNNAEDRAIVIHSAWYADPRMIAEYGKLGRSEGCFVLSERDLPEVLARLGPGRLLFADRFL